VIQTGKKLAPYLVVVAAATGGTALYAHRVADQVNAQSIARAEQRIHEEILACQRGDLVRGVVLLNLRANQGGRTGVPYRRATQVVPVLDCRRTYRANHGLPVPLAPSEQGRFLDQLASGGVPTVLRDGTVR
jgi:hypothetical protein